MTRFAAKATLLIAALAALGACDDPDERALETAVVVPATYDFANVDYRGQQERLAMLTEMKSAMRAAASGEVPTAERLQAMYANGPAAGYSRDYTRDLRSKTFEPVRADFDRYIGRFVASAQTAPGVAAEPGRAGRLSTADGSQTYVFDERGVEWAQVIEKGLMGATFYYQATTVYLGEDRMSADNTTVVPGEGTAMEHHWDEAFGYLGVPRDFPQNTEGLAFWGAYTNRRDPLLGTNAALMTPLKRGRAAISAGNLTVRDEAIAEVRMAWELVAAATTVNYLNGAIADTDTASRLHALSEAVAFAYGLQFNETTRLPRSEYETWLERLAGGRTLETIDLHAVTDADIVAARADLVARYGLSAVAEQL